MRRSILMLSAIMGLSELGHAAEADSSTDRQAIVIRLTDVEQLVVESHSLPLPHAIASKPGLAVFAQGQYDRWVSLPAEDQQFELQAPAPPTTLLASATRGNSTSNQLAIAMSTSQLDQLVGSEVLRDLAEGAIVTPANNAALLNGRLTLRRMPLSGGVPYPADECVFYRGRQEILRVPFPVGKSKLLWRDLAQLLPEQLQSGLPPGKYLLKMAQSAETSRFEIQKPEVRKALLSDADKLLSLLKDDRHPLYLQLAVEAMLKARDEENRPRPYLTDAYDLLNLGAPTSYLDALRLQIADQLHGKHPKDDSSQDSTGIPGVDQARRSILLGQWNEALLALDAPDVGATPRGRALARLYEAVVLSESGPAVGEEAEMVFLDALKALAGEMPADRYRAENNFANFLLRRAQDRLYSHSFQSASGTSHPLFSALQDWRQALVHYTAALELGQSMGPQEAVAVSVNIARLYALLADLVTVLNSSLSDQPRFVAGEKSAIQTARKMADEVLEGEAKSHDTRAVAAEMLAHLAHRAGDHRRCREYAHQALEAYHEAGSLTGAEGIHRLIAISLLSASRASQPDAQQKAERHSALRHLLISHHLAETLREQFPADIIGLSRAGFFARRSYVYEKLIELYVELGEDLEALKYLEVSKARALQDVLMLAGKSADEERTPAPVLAAVLSALPERMLALEYFLGAETALVFVVKGKQVKSYPLTDIQGNPLESRRLIADVRQFLNSTEGTAGKLLQDASARRPFDAAWQHKLHQLYGELIPAEVRDELSGGSELLIVPHHILHYFPFAALVTELDETKRRPLESAMPRFLIEQDVSMIYAPSLSAWQILRAGPAPAASDVYAVGLAEFSSAKPLPGVEKDMANLRDAFGERVRHVLSDEAVTETALAAAFLQPGLLFIGTHGMNVPDQPLASYLLCQSDRRNDGRLMAGEIYGGALSPSIVVLSACYSGLADRSPLPGDDLFGLQRALLHSGVKTVVDGLWDVYDDTGPEVMKKFFEHLAAGQNTPAALAQAQREFIEQRRGEGPQDPWIHPYFWAVYKATGSDLTHIEVNRN